MKHPTQRWLVIFASHPRPPADATAVDVRATSELRAIHAAKKIAPLLHPWKYVSAIPWPQGCPGVDEAVLSIG